ncbi:hypothetical protein NKG94_28830 [Micromonospora sp. M12]
MRHSVGPTSSTSRTSRRAGGRQAGDRRARARRVGPPGRNGGAKLLRRGYNFVDGSDGLGRLDAGLFFIAYQRDPRRQFVPIQTQLARHDVMNEYLRHVSSGCSPVLPGYATAETTGACPVRLSVAGRDSGIDPADGGAGRRQRGSW